MQPDTGSDGTAHIPLAPVISVDPIGQVWRSADGLAGCDQIGCQFDCLVWRGNKDECWPVLSLVNFRPKTAVLIGLALQIDRIDSHCRKARTQKLEAPGRLT